MGEFMNGSESTSAEANGQAHDTQGGNPAEARENLEILSPKKWAVLKELAAGSGVAEAARKADVDRHTVYRWLRTDPRFAAALNAWRGQAVKSAQHRLAGLLDDAAALVHQAIRFNHHNVALEVLRRLGAMEALDANCDKQWDGPRPVVNPAAQNTNGSK
jgi:transposase-like protein